ncbi:MAG: hypothetical protein R3B41_02150 [Candidatus Doudnabacteria bacterium]
MKQILENIRNKPDHKKERLIWIIVGIVVLGMLILWIFSLNDLSKPTSKSTEIIEQVSTDAQNSQDQFPDLFNQQSN